MTPFSLDQCYPGSGPEMTPDPVFPGLTTDTGLGQKERAQGETSQTSQTSSGLCQPVTLGRNTHTSEVCDGSDSQGLCLWMPTVHD